MRMIAIQERCRFISFLSYMLRSFRARWAGLVISVRYLKEAIVHSVAFREACEIAPGDDLASMSTRLTEPFKVILSCIVPFKSAAIRVSYE
jgi:hypothetical protein